MKYVKVNPNYNEVKVSSTIGKWENTRSKKYWDYRRKWYENPQNQIIGKFPLHLDIEATRVCNLRCPMCARTMKNKKTSVEGNNISFELFKKIVDEGAKNGLYSIKLSYLGEPLINKDIVKMVAYAKKQGITDVMFNTNGTLLTEKIARDLIKAGLDKIFISFDSPNPKRYEKIRVGSKFDNVFRNVQKFAEIKKELNSLTPVIRVSMVVMKENKEEVLDYIKMWTPYVDLIGFDDYVNPQGMDKKKRYAIKLRKNKNFVCSSLYQRLFIHYNGQIGLCCTDYDAECNLGNAKDVAIKDVWLGERMQEIRKLHNDAQWFKEPLCGKCQLPYV